MGCALHLHALEYFGGWLVYHLRESLWHFLIPSLGNSRRLWVNNTENVTMINLTFLGSAEWLHTCVLALITRSIKREFSVALVFGE